VKLTDKASGPQGAPAAASRREKLVKTFLPKWREITNYWRQELAQVERSRLLTAAATAVFMFIGTGYVVKQSIDHTQLWNRVFTNGTYIGMTPNRPDLNFRLQAIANGYHINLSAIPVHTAVNPHYDWRSVAQVPISAYAVQVNGQSIAYLKSQSDANTVLTSVRLALKPSGIPIQSTHFAEDVQVSPMQVGITSVTTPQSAVYRILHPNMSGFAGRSGSVAPLAERVAEAKQQPKKRVYLAPMSTKPLISVVADMTMTKKVRIAYPVRYVSDSHLAKGIVRIRKHGVAGVAKERVRLHFVNGKLVSQDIEARNVIEAPQPEIAVRGTNDGIAGGDWAWPSPMFDVTSGFGWRNLHGRHDFHPGIDIGCPPGTPVMASNNGVVEDAGWNSGGYGIWVKIDNGGGIETIYGHLSSVSVHAGQIVAKGQVIGYSGATGHVTGPHLHYEVRRNGTPIPPQNYM
jgi:murein DD-endopeptidase MepM/ murein hydrolase activator NlpD